MKAVVELDVPEWQIGQDVSVYFPDTMLEHGKCKLLKEQESVVRCKDCKWFHQAFENEGRCIKHDNDFHKPDWFCADGERKESR